MPTPVKLDALTDTWTDSGTTYKGIYLDVTNTASAAGSLLQRLDIASAEKFGVDINGYVRIGGSVVLQRSGTTTTVGNGSDTIIDILAKLQINGNQVADSDGATLTLGDSGHSAFLLNDRFQYREGGAVGDGRQYLFMDSSVWSANNGGAALNDANNFHYYDTGDVRAEFECDGLMQFYIEGGTGFDAWYGLQEGATHHWSFGSDVSDSGNLVFNPAFGITSNVMKLSKTGVLSARQFEVTNVGASSSVGGGVVQIRNNDGAAMASGDRMGYVAFGGAEDASSTYHYGATVNAVATEAWSASANGTKIEFEVTANGATGRVKPVSILSSGLQVSGTTITSDVTDTGASSSGGGGAIRARSNDGAAMASGDRMGYVIFGGAEDGASTFHYPSAINCYADEAWSASANGARLTFEVTANGGTSRAVAFSIENDGMLKMASGKAIQLGNTAVAETPTPTHTITVKDASGTTYRVPCVV